VDLLTRGLISLSLNWELPQEIKIPYKIVEAMSSFFEGRVLSQP